MIQPPFHSQEAVLKKVLLAIVVLVCAILLYATTRPDEFRVERAIAVNAPPEKIYPHVADFHQWSGWSPWEKLDTAMTRTYGGSAAGPGAVYAWEGNSDVGKGRMEITDATVPSRVSIKLDFLKPFESHNITDFLLEPAGNTTNVRWVMHGPSNYMTKVMSVFMSMDRMVGKDFERGLANLKALAEK